MLYKIVPAALLALVSAFAQQQQQQQEPPQYPPPGQNLSPQALDNLVAPVALYPDPLLSQILVASTYPLELVQASQWMQRNSRLSGAELTQAAEQQKWDPSVQALVLFTGLIARLNQDVTWTTNLGNAFLNQQAEVMDAVQRMRMQAQQAGRLSTTSQQTVAYTQDSGQQLIEIEPADPNMMYLPEYDPYSIWGPPLYYPYASWRYPRFGAGAYFGFGIGIPIGAYLGGGWGGWGGWGWNPGWRNHSIVINNNFIYRHGFNAGPRGNFTGRPDWSHDATHRQGVPYSNSTLSNRYGVGVRQNLQSRLPRQQQQQQAPTMQRQQQQQWGNGERMGNRQIPRSTPGAGTHGAFSGIREGGAARAQSDHGYSSLGPGRAGGRAAPQQGRPGGGSGGSRGGGRPPRNDD